MNKIETLNVLKFAVDQAIKNYSKENKFGNAYINKMQLLEALSEVCEAIKDVEFENNKLPFDRMVISTHVEPKFV